MFLVKGADCKVLGVELVKHTHIRRESLSIRYFSIHSCVMKVVKVGRLKPITDRFGRKVCLKWEISHINVVKSRKRVIHTFPGFVETFDKDSLEPTYISRNKYVMKRVVSQKRGLYRK